MAEKMPIMIVLIFLNDMPSNIPTVGILQVSRQKRMASMLYFVMGLIYLLRQSIASISMNGATVMLNGGAIHRRRTEHAKDKGTYPSC